MIPILFLLYAASSNFGPFIDARFRGDWMGEIGDPSSDYTYGVSLHIATKNENSIFFYEWPGQKPIQIKTFTLAVVGDRFYLHCGSPLNTGIAGNITQTMNGYAMNGLCLNYSGYLDFAKKYEDLQFVRMANFTGHRDKTVNELMGEFIRSQLAGIDSANLQSTADSLAEIFYSQYLLLKDPILRYDPAASEFVVMIDGCEPFTVPVEINEKDCFKLTFNNRNLDHNIQFQWNEKTGRVIVTYFSFHGKIGYPCPYSSYTYGLEH